MSGQHATGTTYTLYTLSSSDISNTLSCCMHCRILYNANSTTASTSYLYSQYSVQPLTLNMYSAVHSHTLYAYYAPTLFYHPDTSSAQCILTPPIYASPESKLLFSSIRIYCLPQYANSYSTLSLIIILPWYQQL